MGFLGVPIACQGLEALKLGTDESGLLVSGTVKARAASDGPLEITPLVL